MSAVTDEARCVCVIKKCYYM